MGGYSNFGVQQLLMAAGAVAVAAVFLVFILNVSAKKLLLLTKYEDIVKF